MIIVCINKLIVLNDVFIAVHSFSPQHCSTTQDTSFRSVRQQIFHRPTLFWNVLVTSRIVIVSLIKVTPLSFFSSLIFLLSPTLLSFSAFLPTFTLSKFSFTVGFSILTTFITCVFFMFVPLCPEEIDSFCSLMLHPIQKLYLFTQ